MKKAQPEREAAAERLSSPIQKKGRPGRLEEVRTADTPTGKDPACPETAQRAFQQEDPVRPEPSLSASELILRGRDASDCLYVRELLDRLERAHQRHILQLAPEQAELFLRNAVAVEVLRELRNTLLADIAQGARLARRLEAEA